MPELVVPVLTPFAGGGIDVAALAAHCRWVVQEGAAGVMLFGTTGEGPSISVPEKLAAASELVDLLPGVPVIASVTETALPTALECVRGYGELPLRAVLVLPPYYFREGAADGVTAFLDQVAAASAHPVLGYHIPSLAPPVPAEWVAGSTLWGAKDSGGDLAYTRALVAAGKTVYVGAEAVIADAVAAGAAGAIAGMANLLPGPLARLVAAAGDGDLATAYALRDEVLAVQRAVLAAAPELEFITAFKDLAGQLHGHPMGDARLPLRRRRDYLTPSVTAALAVPAR
ncbi:MAG TPA: dihydrodipicolinate synthase family protein [Mycobacteriales bacterium]|nr:dihydrodipicolinate synthase family protein [Mycobacteriales bacterium]